MKMKIRLMIKNLNRLNKPLFISYLFVFAFLIGCGSNTVIKVNQEIDQYTIQGYISSKKDRLSFDVKIKADIPNRYFEIKGFDTLLGKERFLVYYKDSNWYYKDYVNKEEGKMDENSSFLETLPPLAYFDYLSFFHGKIPILKNAEKTTELNKDTYKKSLGNIF